MIEVRMETVSGATIVQPLGEIDLGNATALGTHIKQAQRDRPPRLVIDLQQVPYMDSSGVATLVEAMQVARRQGGRLVLCGMQEKVRSIFEIARLDMVFTIVSNRDEALT